MTQSIDFSIIYKNCAKRLMSFVRTVLAASDLKICTIPNCDPVIQQGQLRPPMHLNGKKRKMSFNGKKTC